MRWSGRSWRATRSRRAGPPRRSWNTHWPACARPDRPQPAGRTPGRRGTPGEPACPGPWALGDCGRPGRPSSLPGPVRPVDQDVQLARLVLVFRTLPVARVVRIGGFRAGAVPVTRRAAVSATARRSSSGKERGGASGCPLGATSRSPSGGPCERNRGGEECFRTLTEIRRDRTGLSAPTARSTLNRALTWGNSGVNQSASHGCTLWQAFGRTRSRDLQDTLAQRKRLQLLTPTPPRQQPSDIDAWERSHIARGFLARTALPVSSP